MAHQRDWLAGIIESLQQRDRRRALREIPHRAVPTGIENGIEVFRLHVRELHRVSESLLRRRVLLEPRHRRGLIFRQIAFRIEWRLPTFRRGQRQLNSSITEYEIRRRELLQPEASLAAGVAQLIMRRQDHQYLHVLLLFFVSSSTQRPRLRSAFAAQYTQVAYRSEGVETKDRAGNWLCLPST